VFRRLGRIYDMEALEGGVEIWTSAAAARNERELVFLAPELPDHDFGGRHASWL